MRDGKQKLNSLGQVQNVTVAVPRVLGQFDRNQLCQRLETVDREKTQFVAVKLTANKLEKINWFKKVEYALRTVSANSACGEKRLSQRP